MAQFLLGSILPSPFRTHETQTWIGPTEAAAATFSLNLSPFPSSPPPPLLRSFVLLSPLPPIRLIRLSRGPRVQCKITLITSRTCLFIEYWPMLYSDRVERASLCQHYFFNHCPQEIWLAKPPLVEQLLTWHACLKVAYVQF